MYRRFLKLFREQYSIKDIRIFTKLQQTSLFSNLSFDALAVLTPLIHKRSYKKGETLFLYQEPAQAVYVIDQGTVQTSIDCSNKAEILAKVSAGDSIGHEALLASSTRLCHAIITSDVAHLYAIASISLHEVLKYHPKIRAQIMYNAANTYKRYTESILHSYTEGMGFFELSQTKVPF